MNENQPNPKFPLGRLLSTPGALGTLHPEDVQGALERHQEGDWGELGVEDRAENELALREGYRLFAVYRDRAGVTFWIITEAECSATTVLLPDEY